MQEQKGEERSVSKWKSTATNLSSHVPISSSSAQDAHLAETQQSLIPIRPQHQQRQRQNQQFEGGENFDYHIDRKTGWRCYRATGKPAGSIFIFHLAVADFATANELELMAAYIISVMVANEKVLFALVRSMINCQFRKQIVLYYAITSIVGTRSFSCRQDTHSQHTSVQHSLFTSTERIARPWLKSHGLQCHLCAHEKNLVIRCCKWFTRCWWLTCRSPRAHHLPHSLSLLPRHKNTQHNRDNTIYSKNTHSKYLMNLSALSQSTSRAIKNHSGLKTCRVAETRAGKGPTQRFQERVRWFFSHRLARCNCPGTCVSVLWSSITRTFHVDNFQQTMVVNGRRQRQDPCTAQTLNLKWQAKVPQTCQVIGTREARISLAHMEGTTYDSSLSCDRLIQKKIHASILTFACNSQHVNINETMSLIRILVQCFVLHFSWVNNGERGGPGLPNSRTTTFRCEACAEYQRSRIDSENWKPPRSTCSSTRSTTESII